MPSPAAGQTASVGVDPGAVVRFYGAPGTFGGLDGRPTTPTGEPLATAPVPGWGFLPGQSAYFPAVAPDGAIVIANEPQTDNQLMPTARQMALTTFDPATRRFANVVVPTSTGQTELGGPWPAASGVVGGGDVSDVGVIRAGRATRVAFTSAMPFWGWASGGGEYPTLGVLAKDAAGRWAVDRRRSRTASELAANAAHARLEGVRDAARRKGRKARRAAHAAAVATGDACTTRSYPGLDTFGDCRMPAEFAQLPSSQGLVVTQYAFDDPSRPSGRLTVIDPVRGRVLASYAYPAITTVDGSPLAVHPREVVADPRGTRRAERFVVIFDTERGRGDGGASVAGAMQEFSFDADTGTIVPRSVPILTGDRAPDGAPLGFETATYDARGDLWAGQSEVGTLQAGALAVYRRSARGDVLGARAGCSASPAWHGQGWGRTCVPDVRVAAAADLGIARSLDPLPGGTVVLSTMPGRVLAVRRGADGNPVAGRPLDLGLDLLADRSVTRIGPRKAAYDPTRRLLWLPIQQLATARTCAQWPCTPTPLDQWLVAIDVTRLG